MGPQGWPNDGSATPPPPPPPPPPPHGPGYPGWNQPPAWGGGGHQWARGSGYEGAAGAPATDEWERTYALFTHLSLLLAHMVPVIPALVMWLIKRDQSHFVDDHGREALNFQISIVIYVLACIPFTFIFIGIPALMGVYGLAIVGMIMGTIAASKGRFFRYPMCLRLVRPSHA